MPWTDFRLNPLAEWMSNIWGAAQHAVQFPDRHAWLTLPGVSILSVAVDWMHVKYLGTDQYFIGTILWLMCYVILPGPPP